MSNITETLKQKLDELDIDRRLDEFVDQAERSVQSVLAQAGHYVHDRRGDIDRVLDSATETINTRTQGKYADQVIKVRGHVVAGVDKLAGQRPDQDPSDNS
jgi:hypothetical protein